MKMMTEQAQVFCCPNPLQELVWGFDLKSCLNWKLLLEHCRCLLENSFGSAAFAKLHEPKFSDLTDQKCR